MKNKVDSQFNIIKKDEQYILRLHPNYCYISAFIIDPSLAIMGFIFTIISFLLYTWWSILLALAILIVSFGILKSLFLKEVTLYKNKIILKWYIFQEKTIYINKIKKIGYLTAGWCWQLALFKRNYFNFDSTGTLISASVLGEEETESLRKEMKKIISKDN